MRPCLGHQRGGLLYAIVIYRAVRVTRDKTTALNENNEEIRPRTQANKVRPSHACARCLPLCTSKNFWSCKLRPEARCSKEVGPREGLLCTLIEQFSPLNRKRSGSCLFKIYPGVPLDLIHYIAAIRLTK